MSEKPGYYSPSPLSGKKIIIAGAGISGLGFVVSLKSIWSDRMGVFPEIVQFERETAEPDLTREGFSLSIRSGGISLGIQSLKQMGLLRQVVAAGVTREDDMAAYHGLWSLNWHKLVSLRHPALAGLPRSPMRIARAKLRMILLDASGQRDKIHWGLACTSIISSEKGITRVGLANGTVEECDMLIIADGANSKLRTCFRPHDKLNFAGPISISAVSRFRGPPPAPVDRAWGIIPSGRGVSLFVSPMGDGSINWCISYIAASPQREHRQPMPVQVCDHFIREAKRLGSGFSEPFTTLVDNSDLSTLMVFNAMDKPPFAHSMANGVPVGVVFIGDSNHAVSAFAANGANLALADAYDLAECMCTHTSTARALEEFDRRSMPRASVCVEESHLHIALVHSCGVHWAVSYARLIIYACGLKLWYMLCDLLSIVYSEWGSFVK